MMDGGKVRYCRSDDAGKMKGQEGSQDDTLMKITCFTRERCEDSACVTLLLPPLPLPPPTSSEMPCCCVSDSMWRGDGRDGGGGAARVLQAASIRGPS